MAGPTGFSIVKLVVKFKNLMLFWWHPRDFLNVRWADILTDSAWNALDFSGKQFYRVYMRWSSKYRYHPQQMKHNVARNFDPDNALASRMAASGTGEYYNVLPSTRNALRIDKRADLTSHRHCESLHDVLEVLNSLTEDTSSDRAKLAVEVVARGLTREVQVNDDDDWELLRNQLRTNEPEVQLSPDTARKSVYPFAVSYKGMTETFVSNVTLRKPGEEMDKDMKEELEISLKQMRTTDFLDDRRWDQLQRGVREYARSRKYDKVSLWVDRVRNIGRTDEEAFDINNALNWTEYGLYPYMLMPTVRVFATSENDFTTSFWRKVETTLAISGKGLICDDYMLRKFDSTIYYDQHLYQRLRNGVIVLGGKNTFVRSTILAFATMIITDGLLITASNEHHKTKSSILQWKSWAIRCITEEAFAAHAPAVPTKNKPPSLNFDAFKLLSSWEHDLCYSDQLTGGSYLNVTYQRSREYSRASAWNGISEWIGMWQYSFIMDKESREAVMNYLNFNTTMDMYAAPSGHTAARICLKNGNKVLKSLVVETSRFSTATHGQVLAVADATGHCGRSIVPWYLRLKRDPDGDQQCQIQSGEVFFLYKPMTVGLSLWILCALIFLLFVVNIALLVRASFVFLLVLDGVVLFVFLYGVYAKSKKQYGLKSSSPSLSWWPWPWPWADYDDIGEALFDNVLLDSLYSSGIKSIFRKVRTADYRSIEWR